MCTQLLPSYLEEKVPKTKHYNAKNTSSQYIHKYLRISLSHCTTTLKKKNYHSTAILNTTLRN